MLVYGKPIKNVPIGTRRSFADIGQTIAEYLGAEKIINGESFLQEISAYENV